MTTTTAKATVATNYTDAQVAKLIELYAGGNGESVSVIAGVIGKTSRSIVAKLAALHLYVNPTKKGTTKTGEKAESKEQLVQDIADAMACTSEELSGLEKSNKSTLLRLKNYILAA